jgi:hypothetical protein
MENISLSKCKLGKNFSIFWHLMLSSLAIIIVAAERTSAFAEFDLCVCEF